MGQTQTGENTGCKSEECPIVYEMSTHCPVVPTKIFYLMTTNSWSKLPENILHQAYKKRPLAFTICKYKWCVLHPINDYVICINHMIPSRMFGWLVMGLLSTSASKVRPSKSIWFSYLFDTKKWLNFLQTLKVHSL